MLGEKWGIIQNTGTLRTYALVQYLMLGFKHGKALYNVPFGNEGPNLPLGHGPSILESLSLRALIYTYINPSLH